MRHMHDGKVGCDTAEYTTAFQYSDWLYFLWHGININKTKYKKPQDFSLFVKQTRQKKKESSKLNTDNKYEKIVLRSFLEETKNVNYPH